MSDINITVNGSTFTGNSAVIRNLYEVPEPAEIDYDQIVKELREIKACLKSGTRDYQTVDELERAGRKRSWSELRAATGKFASQFTNSALANLTGVYLSRLLGL